MRFSAGASRRLESDCGWAGILPLAAQGCFALRSNVHPRVTGHPAWRDTTDTPQHNKRNNRLEQ
jgi:hypothetical protein